MKKLISCAVIMSVAMIAVTFAGPDKAAIEAKEKAAWQAFKDKNEGAFKKLLDKDVRCVYADGVQKFSDEMDNMQKWDMKSFVISNFDSFSDEKDVIVTTYTVKVEGTMEGKDGSGTYNAGSVWKEEKGVWMVIFHTNMKQEAAAK